MDDFEGVHSKEVVRLWRGWRTAHEMIADRGYELTEEEINISFEDFKARFVMPEGIVNRAALNFRANPSHDMVLKHMPLPSATNPDPLPNVGPIYVEFLAEAGSLGVGAIRKFMEGAAARGFNSGIMITAVPVSPGARKHLAALESLVRVECFIEEDLLVNITRHELVPRHVLLSQEEKFALLKRYRLKETQLPRILSSDPVARYLGLRRGHVVKIIRNSETAGRYASYRLTV